MDLVTLKIVLEFFAVLCSGLYFGGCLYASKTHMPGLLAAKDLAQSVLSFQRFWPRRFEMPLFCFIAGVSGIAVYLIDGEKPDLPWLGAGLGMLSMLAYTALVLNPYSVNQLMGIGDPREKQDKEIVSLFKAFNKFHHVRTAVGGCCFIAFTYYLYCT